VTGSQELDVLLASARTVVDSERLRELVSRGTDWRAVLDLCHRHDVAPLVHRTVRSALADEIPHWVHAELEQCQRDAVIRNLFLVSELLRVNAALSQAAVPVAAFKGPVLAQDAYDDFSLRDFCDLDILVRPADLDRAETVLQACGYDAVMGDRSYRSAFLGYHGQYTFTGPAGAVIDLHWRLSGKGVTFPLLADEVWPELRDLVLERRNLQTFSENHMVLFLAAHGTKEHWSRLKWLCDFAEFVRHHRGIDWTWVSERAERSGCSRALLLPTLLAAEWLDAPVPSDLLERARCNEAIHTLARQVQASLTRVGAEGQDEEFLRTLTAEERLMRRVVRVGTHLTTRTVGDHRAMPLPRALWPAYYGTRVFRLAYLGLRTLLRTLHNRDRRNRPSPQ
jgi:hypothetical protein